MMSDSAGSEQPDPSSLEELFEAYETPLLRYTIKLVKNLDVSQEIVQEAFMRLHAQFDTVRQPRPWLYRTAHNLAINHLRSGQKIVPLEFDQDTAASPEQAESHPSPDAQMERMEAIEQTRSCIQALAERERELIRMKFEEGLSYKEMSEQTGLSVSNVGYILHHALKQVASNLENTGVSL